MHGPKNKMDKSRIGVIGSLCIIPGSIDVDGLVMVLVSNGESSFYTLRGGIPHPLLV